MRLQIIALLMVVVSFTALVIWVYWPANKNRLDEAAQQAITEEPGVNPQEKNL